MLVYDVTDRASFTAVRSWMKQIDLVNAMIIKDLVLFVPVDFVPYFDNYLYIFF